MNAATDSWDGGSDELGDQYGDGDSINTPESTGNDEQQEETLEDVIELMKTKSVSELTMGLAETVCNQAGDNPEKIWIVLHKIREAQKEMMKLYDTKSHHQQHDTTVSSLPETDKASKSTHDRRKLQDQVQVKGIRAMGKRVASLIYYYFLLFYFLSYQYYIM
jgi:hypothetical protein